MKPGVKIVSFKRRDARGFTLLEVLVAVALLSVVSGIVYASFAGVVNSTEEAREVAEEMRLQQFLMRSFLVNIPQAYEDWRPGAALRETVVEGESQDLAADTQMTRFLFQGINEEGPDGPADSLTFASSAPLIGNMALPGFLKQVSYSAQTREQRDAELDFNQAQAVDDQGTTLTVIETPILSDVDPTAGGTLAGQSGFNPYEDEAEAAGVKSPGWSIPIQTMDIQYFDGEDWREDWDSEVEGRLPWSLRIRINFAKSPEELEADQEIFDPEEDPDFELIVPVPAGLGVTQEPPQYIRSTGVPGRGGSQVGAGGFGVPDSATTGTTSTTRGVSGLGNTPTTSTRRP